MGTSGTSAALCDGECIRLVRPNILSVKQFETERSSLNDLTDIQLADLNENPLGPCISWGGWHEGGQHHAALAEACLASRDPAQGSDRLSRYPDVRQLELKQAFCDFRNRRHGSCLSPSNICVSAGLDDMIDLIIRCVCRPGRDKILICPPVYHMYQTSATINDVATLTVPLLPHRNFQLQLSLLQQTLTSDPTIKICFICTPGNPTGHAILIDDIVAVLENPAWHGILVVDEAYIDFSPHSPSTTTLITRYPRLVVLQTLSKGFGLAGIRVGFAAACSHFSAVLNNVRKPYAVSSLSLLLAKVALSEASIAVLEANLRTVFDLRLRLARDLERIEGVRVKGGLDGNFVLFEVLGDSNSLNGGHGFGSHSPPRPCNVVAGELARLLRDLGGVLVRFKGLEHGCEGCIRVSVGTGPENMRFVEKVRLLMQRLRLRAALPVLAGSIPTTMLEESVGMVNLGAAA
ncbi:pyridoxal phosphate-dependent transferase [Cercophora newfieldiana]|uniref:histidinol-phosphate transaminase n=1 Tax=Cercophora newfieldiana TaxID=92897 RepID=A0AA39YSX6_9PEZI|nr:pyridoxal phosphate-dependent transferase [Cercophora newfieldiana]